MKLAESSERSPMEQARGAPVVVRTDRDDPARDADKAQALKWISERWSPGTIDAIPGLRYWDVEEGKRKYSVPENLVGHQQRAFDLYWGVYVGVRGGVALGVGTAGVNGPSTFGTDKYAGWNPVYKTGIGVPHMLWNADEASPFQPGTFDAVISNHVFEHMENQEHTLFTWLNLLRVGGLICMVIPDMAFLPRGTLDPSHTREFSALEFWDWLDRLSYLDGFEMVEYNVLDNNFSFSVVLKRV